METTTITTAQSKTSLYERLASDIKRQIEAGIYRPGQRIPSVRQTSRQYELSITTVLQAYQVLEDQGWIEARPQSGYYVRSRGTMSAPEPALSMPPDEPFEISIEELVMNVLHNSTDQKFVQFGAAIPAPDLLPNQKMSRILSSIARQEDPRQNLCSMVEGIEELRIQAAQRAARAGCVLSSDAMLITNGAMEALNLSLRAVCQPGDLVAVESPTYFGILQALESLGMRVLEIPTHYQDGISLEALRFALEHHPVRACVVITNFNNPLGSCMSDENKRKLVEMLADHDIPLIEDDIFGELHFDERRPPVAKAFDTQDNVLLCSSYSKDISPGFRLGWLAPGRYYSRVARIKMALNLGTAFFTQMATARFLESGGYDHHLRRIRRAYAEKVSLMSNAVLQHFPAGTHLTSPRGGFVLWVQLPENVDSLVLYRQALQAGITIAPGYIFSATNKYRNYIRLNAGYWSYQALSALERLGGLVHNLAKVG